jgi:hypothetical protein
MPRFPWFSSAVLSCSPRRGAGKDDDDDDELDDVIVEDEDAIEAVEGGEAAGEPAAGAAAGTPAGGKGGAAAGAAAGQPAAGQPAGQPAAGQAAAAAAQQQQDALLAFAERELGFRDLRNHYADGVSWLRGLASGYQTLQQQLQRSEQERMALMQRAQQPAPAAPAPGAPGAGGAADPLAALRGPEYDPSWLNQVTRDEKGNLVANPGADPMIVPKLHAALRHRQSIMEKFADNPGDFLKPILEHYRATEIDKAVQNALSTKFGAFQEETYANTFVNSNAGWLFAYDSQNQLIRNPHTQQPILSNDGRSFYGFLAEAARFGITVPRAREEYARAKLAAHLSSADLANKNAGRTGENKKQQVIDQLNRRPNRGGSTVAADDTGHTGAPQNKNLDITEMLRASFAGKGITDAVIADAEY